jgi:hypothetical protein
MPKIRKIKICTKMFWIFKHVYHENLKWFEVFWMPEIWDVWKYPSFKILTTSWTFEFHLTHTQKKWKSTNSSVVRVLKKEAEYFFQILGLILFMKRNLMSITFTCSTTIWNWPMQVFMVSPPYQHLLCIKSLLYMISEREIPFSSHSH